jgi:hypothetical protein
MKSLLPVTPAGEMNPRNFDIIKRQVNILRLERIQHSKGRIPQSVGTFTAPAA